MLVCLIGAIFAIGLKAYPYGRTGVEIVYISAKSPAFESLQPGMFITELNGQPIESASEWQARVANLTGVVNLTVNGKKYSFIVNESIGIEVLDISRTNLDMGLDLRGGTRTILKPESNASKEIIDQVIATLQTRANMYGLKEINFFPVGIGNEWYVQIEATGLGRGLIEDLLAKQGNFEAKLIKPVSIEGNKGNLIIGSQSYPISLSGNNLIINETIVGINDSFFVNGIKLTFLNVSQNNLILIADLFTGKDIELVYTDPQHSAVVPQGSAWSFYFAILLSKEGAQRFADLTTGISKHIDLISGEEYLDSKLLLYLDGQLVSELNIAANLAGQFVQTPQVQGTRAEREQALQEKLRLQTILRSGALPVKLETVSVGTISPTLGSNFFFSAGLAAGLAVIIVSGVIFIRYKSLKIALPMIAVVLSEIAMILGIAATNDWAIWLAVLIVNILILSLAWWKKYEPDAISWAGAIAIPIFGFISWTIDLPAIAGIIAAIGTGVNDQVIIADESLRKVKEVKKVYTIREKIKRAFFIVFGAAATVIAAMLPLMFLGIGLVRGFAITTVIGVLVGILITRPAYAQIVERAVKE
jgi:preprotein translocase subunit SecD